MTRHRMRARRQRAQRRRASLRKAAPVRLDAVVSANRLAEVGFDLRVGCQPDGRTWWHLADVPMIAHDDVRAGRVTYRDVFRVLGLIPAQTPAA